MSYQRLNVELRGTVATIELNRPERANALDLTAWHELRTAMRWLDATPGARVGILRGAGAQFTSGIDLALLLGIREQIADTCEARTRERLRQVILDLQDTVTAIERCRKPVLAAIHGACLGGGVDIAVACDLRYCSVDAVFSVKEVDVGMTADVGTLQRLPKLVGEGVARELAYTARHFDGREAHAIGLANRCFDTPAALFAGVEEIASAIAAKSPLAVRGTKAAITYARDHSVADGLDQIANWNAAMLLSADLGEAISAAREKRPPKFRD
jgi:enoyl-CoA hydratase/carnithine racemase